MQLLVKQGFNGLCRPGVHFPAAFGYQRAIGNILGERVLKGILDFGKGGLLIDKLGRLQTGEQGHEYLLSRVGDLGQQAERELPANHCRGLEQLFFCCA